MQVCSAPEIGWCTNSGSSLQKKNSMTNKYMHAHIASFLGPLPSFSLFSVWGKPRQRRLGADTSKFNINYESTVWLTHCVQDSIFLSFLHWHIQREWNQMETNTRHRCSSARRQKHYENETMCTQFGLCCMPDLHGSCEVVCCVPDATASLSSLHYNLEKCLP